MRSLRREVVGANVASGVENVGERAARTTQVRYYYDEDLQVAEKVSGVVDNVLQVNSELVVLPALRSKVRQGTIEVWIGRSYDPPTRDVFYVCEGSTKVAALKMQSSSLATQRLMTG